MVENIDEMTHEKFVSRLFGESSSIDSWECHPLANNFRKGEMERWQREKRLWLVKWWQLTLKIAA